MKYRRSRNLDDAAIADIVAVLDGWSGKLSWALLLESIERRTKQRYTRQALSNHARIAEAFRLRKGALSSVAERGARSRRRESAMDIESAMQRLALLETENQRLSAENNRLIEQFVRWAYNAYTRGLDKAFLDRPLPAVNRDLTLAASRRRGKP